MPRARDVIDVNRRWTVWRGQRGGVAYSAGDVRAATRTLAREAARAMLADPTSRFFVEEQA